MTTKMNKVFDDIKKMGVLDPCPYVIEKRIINCIVDKKHISLIAFPKGSYADNKIDKNYWKKEEYSAYLPAKKRGSDIVWYSFQGNHMKIVN